MIRFLTDAFGFQADEIHEEGGRVSHALLGWGRDLVMVSSRRPDDPFDLGQWLPVRGRR